MVADTEAVVGQTDVLESKVPDAARAAFAAVDGPVHLPVGADAQGALTGELDLDGGVYLPEENPHDAERRALKQAEQDARRTANIRRVLAVALSLVVVIALYLLATISSEPFNAAQFVRNCGLVIAIIFGGSEALNLSLRPKDDRRPRSGNPGVFLLGDLLIVRRHGNCQVFPRAALLGIDEVRRRASPGAGPGSEYEVTLISFRARNKKGRGEYTLDVGPPLGAPLEPGIAAAERVRKARLRRLQAWAAPQS